MNPLLTLLQINDSVFPIGGFTQSYGLETYVHKQVVHDSKTAQAYAQAMLQESFYYNDAAFFMLAWNICTRGATQAKILLLDQRISSLKAPAEIREASKKLGIRFLKIVAGFKTVARCKRYLTAIQNGDAHGHYAMAFAMYAHAQKIPFEDALTAFYYNNLNGIITNCAKLVPISQMDGQQILFKLQPLIQQLVATQRDLPDELIGNCCVAQDIRCMQHEKLYTRIYIS